MNKDPYHLFYDFYNHHYDHHLKDAFLKIIQKHLKKGPIIECGCGPAHISIALKKMGFNVVASDISDDFLMQAKNNAALENIELNTLHQNVLSPFDKTYHAVIMVFDVINHLETLNDFARAIKHIYDALETEGLFILDNLRCDYINDMIGYDEILMSGGEPLNWTITKGPHPCSFRHRLKRNNLVTTLNQRSFDEKTMRSLLSMFKMIDQIRLDDRDIYVLKK